MLADNPDFSQIKLQLDSPFHRRWWNLADYWSSSQRCVGSTQHAPSSYNEIISPFISRWAKATLWHQMYPLCSKEWRHWVRIEVMVRNIKTEADAWPYMWTCSTMWSKRGVSPGAPCSEDQQTFNCWYLDMAIDHSVKRKLYMQTISDHEANVGGWQMTFQETHTRRNVHTSTFSSHVQSEKVLWWR